MAALYRLVAKLAFLVLILDQASKLWVRLDLFAVDPFGVVKVAPFFNLILRYNPGVSFSWFADYGELGRWFLSALTVIIVVVILWWLRSEPRKWPTVGVGLVVGGALGNLIDRLYIGAVVDFFDFHVSGWHYATFNVADSAIFCGVGFILFDLFFVKQEK